MASGSERSSANHGPVPRWLYDGFDEVVTSYTLHGLGDARLRPIVLLCTLC